MAELSDAFVALPGGLGTLEELFEVWTWGQLGYHAKPLGLLDVNGFYSKLGSFLDHVVEEGFVRPQHRAMLQLADSPAELLDAMDSFEAPVLPKWVDKKPD
ncbi:LOG family protein YvdD [compost metagenome]